MCSFYVRRSDLRLSSWAEDPNVVAHSEYEGAAVNESLALTLAHLTYE